jgi:cobaltochelatase CobS
MQTKTKVVKYGKIEVPISDGLSPYMPQKAGKFIDHGDIMKTLAIAVRDNMAVLMIGESGTGKTSAIRYLANQTGNGLRRVNLNGGTTADELVGRLLINDKGTYWVDGILTEAMRKGEWIVLDEINAALPEVLFVLQSVMDDDGYLVLTEKDDKEIVHKHTNFRIFATCNPPEYAGTKEMNKALLSRFAICISADFPPVAKELEIIEHKLGNAVAKSEMAQKLVGLANETRKAKELGTADYAINTRDVLNVLSLSEFMEPADALELAFGNKLDSADNKALKIMAKLHLPASKKKGSASRKPITDVAGIIIGNTYVMDADMHNVYFGMTKKEDEFKTTSENDVGTIISQSSGQPAIKGDEFVVEAAYYEDGNSLVTKETTGDGDKVASAIKIIAGPNKGNKAVIIHHKDLEGSMEIIKSLYEIS